MRRFCLLALLSLGISLSAEAASFYRIIYGPNPGPARAAVDRFAYGANVLYTGDARKDGPTRVNGIVWHANLEEAQYFVGTQNPVIEERDLLKLIENDKWEEAKLLQKYAPDAFPRTENLALLIRELKLSPSASSRARYAALISETLRQRYPEGFFLKPVSGFNSAGTFPSESSDFAAILEAYLRDVKPVIQEKLDAGIDPTTVHLETKDLPNYSGRVIEALLEHPEQVIVQAKIAAAIGTVLQTPQGPKPLLVEYRVHVVEGKVLKGATESRWEDARLSSPEGMARAEAFAQSVIDRLPEAARRMSYAMDVMRTRSGLHQIIELNPGGESGYFYPDTDLWVTQLLAARFQGGHTPLLEEFKRFSEAPSLEAKETALTRLLERPELKELKDAVGPITELFAQAKNVLLRELKQEPTRDNAFAALVSLKKFHLEVYLTFQEVQTFANLLHDPGILSDVGASLSRVSELLALGPGEILFVGTGSEIGLINGLGYDDLGVHDLLLARLHEEFTPPTTIQEARLRARQLIDRSIATRSELASGKVTSENISKALETPGSGSRLFYSGTREALVRILSEGWLERVP